MIPGTQRETNSLETKYKLKNYLLNLGVNENYS